MYTRYKKILYNTILIILISISPTSVSASEFTFLTHFLRPFSYEENGHITGYAVEIVEELMKKMDHQTDIEIYPFIRALKKIQREPGYALFIVAKRPDREKKLKWVGPIAVNNVYFYKNRDSNVRIENVDDIKNLKSVAVGRGNADHTFLLSRGFTNIYPTNTQAQSLKMLSRDRVDVTPMGELVMPEMAKQAGIDVKEIERTRVKLYESILYLAFSKETPDSTITKWQQCLEHLKKSKKYKTIRSKYGLTNP